jgi:hypothetical protein
MQHCPQPSKTTCQLLRPHFGLPLGSDITKKAKLITKTPCRLSYRRMMGRILQN